MGADQIIRQKGTDPDYLAFLKGHDVIQRRNDVKAMSYPLL